MTLTAVTVTGSFNGPDGSPLADGTLIFRTRRWDLVGVDILVPDTITATITDGAASIVAYASADGEKVVGFDIDVEYFSPTTGRIARQSIARNLIIPNTSPVSLGSLLDDPLLLMGGGSLDIQLRQELRDARDQAVAAAGVASTAAGIAAGEVGLNRDLASATAALSLANGMVFSMGGRLYQRSTATTLANSATADLGVAGIIAFGERVYVDQFGGIGNGTADDTLALERAFATGQIVDLEDKTWRYVAATHSGPPAMFAKTLRGAGFTLRCEGAVQFDMPDGFDWQGGTVVSTDVFTVDKTLPRSSNPSSVHLISNGASGTTRPITNGRCYLNFRYLVTVNDGTSKGEGFIRIAGATAADLEWNCVITGAILPLWVSSEGGSNKGVVHFENCETCLYTRSGPAFGPLSLSLINTPTQQKNFRPTNTAGSLNGKDTWLNEASANKSLKTDAWIHTEYAVERGGYLQNIANGTIRSWSIGCDGGKTTDGCQNLTIYSDTTLTTDGNSHQRYSWQNYGMSDAPNINIRVHPKLRNNTGVSGNKECAPFSGWIRDCFIHDPYAYDCGWGVWLVNGISETFGCNIDGLTIIGGRVEGPGGVAPTNGAIKAFTTFPAASGYTISNVRVIGLSTDRVSSGTTILLNGVAGEAIIAGCSVDGLVTATAYNAQVQTTNCANGRVDAWQTSADNGGFSFVYPRPFPRTRLVANTTGVIVVGTLNAALGADVVTVEVELRASHNTQPNNNSIDYRAKMFIGTTGTTRVAVEWSSLVNQTLTLSYDTASREVRLTQVSTTPLGFVDSSFYSNLKSTVAMTPGN